MHVTHLHQAQQASAFSPALRRPLNRPRLLRTIHVCECSYARAFASQLSSSLPKLIVHANMHTAAASSAGCVSRASLVSVSATRCSVLVYYSCLTGRLATRMCTLHNSISVGLQLDQPLKGGKAQISFFLLLFKFGAEFGKIGIIQTHRENCMKKVF